MKEISPKKYINVQSSGSFKVWAKSMKEFIFWHDAKSKELIEYFEQVWLADQKLTYADIKQGCLNKDVSPEVDAALHMVISAFLEGESKVLADTAELTDADSLTSHKSGLELWRLLSYNFDRASTFNIINIVEFIRSMQPAKNMSDVLSKMASLERVHQEYYKTAIVSKDPDFIKMKEHNISIYPEVFKKADLIKILPEAIVKELKKSTNIDFEKDKYDSLRDRVTTIVQNHLGASSPMEVEKNFVMKLDEEDKPCAHESFGAGVRESHHSDAKNEEYAQPYEEHQGYLYDEDGGFLCYIGGNGKGGYQQKGKGKGKGKGKSFQGNCYNCGKVGHRSVDCWAGAKGKSKGKGDSGKGKGKGKGINAFENQAAFVPQPQPIHQQRPPQYYQQNGPTTLMETSWNGYSGNYGGLNLYALTKDPVKTQNKFEALTVDEPEVQVHFEFKEGPRVMHIRLGMLLKSHSRRFEKKKKPKSQKRKKLAEPTDILACLISASAAHEAVLNKLEPYEQDEYEEISIMIDSGASETVSSDDKFPHYELV